MELWVNRTPQTLSDSYHYNLDEYIDPALINSSRGELNKQGAVYMKQGLYHCNPTVQTRTCPGSSSTSTPLTPVQIIYHDGMSYVNCDAALADIISQRDHLHYPSGWLTVLMATCHGERFGSIT